LYSDTPYPEEARRYAAGGGLSVIDATADR
jgi:hypothetical protein